MEGGIPLEMIVAGFAMTGVGLGLIHCSFFSPTLFSIHLPKLIRIDVHVTFVTVKDLRKKGPRQQHACGK